MLLLTGTSDIIRVVTGTTGSSIQVHASWVDNNAGTITPGRTNTAAITTNTTTTVVGSPAASTQRNVKHLNITNAHATVATQVTVQHFDGTTSEDLMSVTLLPGENLVLDAEGSWTHHDAQGGEYSYTVPARPNLGITGTIAETMPRELCPEVNSTVPSASGTLFMQAIYLTAGQVINNIILSSGTTAAGTPTNYAAGIFDGTTRNLLANTANQTTTAWAANTVKTIPLTAAFRVPTSGLYYIGFYMTATTIITMKGGTARTGGQLAGTAPIISGTSSTGLTTALPNPAAALTSSTASMYAAVS
jgi:hypothetical protein